jgi:hypothetical protein
MRAKGRAVAWVKEDPFGVEFVEVRLSGDRLSARGTAIGTEPVPYRLDYRLVTGLRFATSRLRVAACGEGWRRTLDLRRQPSAAWTVSYEADGESVPPPIDREGLSAALDCDLGLSPLTNSMPVLRHDLLRGGGPIDFRVAWISVPDLAVHLEVQRYRFIRYDGDESVIRFETADGSFAADLTFDPDGLVRDYPGLARRL